MSDRTLRSVVTGLAGLLVLVIAITLLIMVGRGRTASTSPSESPIAIGSPSAPDASSPAPTDGTSAAPSEAAPTATPESTPLPSPSTAASAGPSGSPLPGTMTTLTFVGLKLDATNDPSGQQRIVTFRTDGPGTVTAKLASSSPQGTTHMCLRIGSKEVGCKDWASGTFTGKTSQAHANWTVTLQGSAIATPTVDLTVTFQAVAPSVKIEHARFDGTASPATNGIQARFVARAPGDVHLVAEWGGHPFLYDVDLTDETTGTGQSFDDQGPSTNVDQSVPVTAGTWRLVLKNSEAGFGTTDLTATIRWP